MAKLHTTTVCQVVASKPVGVLNRTSSTSVVTFSHRFNSCTFLKFGINETSSCSDQPEPLTQGYDPPRRLFTRNQRGTSSQKVITPRKNNNYNNCCRCQRVSRTTMGGWDGLFFSLSLSTCSPCCTVAYNESGYHISFCVQLTRLPQPRGRISSVPALWFADYCLYNIPPVALVRI